MSSRKTLVYAGALAGAVTLALVGCNGGGGSASPSPSRAVSVPAAARAHSEAGAIEFAKFSLS